MKKLLAVLLFLNVWAFAQSNDESKKDPTVYKIDFVVAEVQGGQRTNVRNYSMFLQADHRPHSTKVGNRIPVAAGKEGQFQYLDVGLNLNCDVSSERDNAVVINFNFDLSTLITPDANAVEHTPVVRQIRQDGAAFLTLGKATTISSADDTNTSRTVIVEATATRVK
jgi:hypothetical protein